jgi:hypothetical protein
MSKTHYEVLGVNQLAGGAKIKRHYYELCKRYHPDVGGGSSAKMIAINQAYRILSNATLKSAYDRELAARKATARQTVTQQQFTSEPTIHRSTQTATPKKKSGWVWFMAAGSLVAAGLIAINYVMPLPKAANTTINTPTVATTDTPTDTQSPSIAPNNTADKATQEALTTLHSDTTAPSQSVPTQASPATTTDSAVSTPTPTPHKHHRSFSLW